MSEFIKHECGIGMVRLLKPLDFYADKYGTPLYGLNKLNLLMNKIRNRGQDGAGVATIKLDMLPGERYISRHRSNDRQALQEVFDHIYQKHFNDLKPMQLADVDWLKRNVPYIGEIMMAHLRYGTHGANSIESVHPFLRQSNWMTRNLVVAGNFNLTNVRELFEELVALGQHPKELSDTVTVLEKIGHFLDDEVDRLINWHKPEGFSRTEINEKIIEGLDIQRLLRRATKKFDGGYVIAGMIGHGDAFVMRDPSGIRPAFWYQDDEVIVVCSERPAIQTAFNVKWDKVQEIAPAHALIIRRNGEVMQRQYTEPLDYHPCSFERIYFSRGTDRDIYLERKQLGRNLARRILKSVNHDFENTVFSYVPNTAETSYFGLVEEAEEILNQRKQKQIAKLRDAGKLTDKKMQKILAQKIRREKLIIKDEKLRTFIADDSSRGSMVHYGYDVTYGIVNNDKDTLVIVDDSIVRGTTLRDSIISIIERLHPKRIIVVSSAPQIRYPDCYGIDMSRLKKFVAFNALINLLKRDGKQKLIEKAYKRAKASVDLPLEQVENELKPLYDRYAYDDISDEIARIITPPHLDVQVEVVYQTLEGLHAALGPETGDWYFSGKYPTPGGMRVVNRAFINYYEGSSERAY